MHALGVLAEEGMELVIQSKIVVWSNSFSQAPFDSRKGVFGEEGNRTQGRGRAAMGSSWWHVYYLRSIVFFILLYKTLAVAFRIRFLAQALGTFFSLLD